MNHEFHSWKQAYRDGMSQNGYYDKRKSVVNFDTFLEDIKAVGDVVRAYKETKRIAPRYEVINGVTFYYKNMVNVREADLRIGKILQMVLYINMM